MQIAQKLAASPRNKVGFSPTIIISIISVLFRAWQACHPDKQPPPAKVRRRIQNQYRIGTQDYDPEFIQKVTDSVKQTADVHNLPAASPQEHHDFAVEILESFRNGTIGEIQEALNTVKEIGS